MNGVIASCGVDFLLVTKPGEKSGLTGGFHTAAAASERCAYVDDDRRFKGHVVSLCGEGHEATGLQGRPGISVNAEGRGGGNGS